MRPRAMILALLACGTVAPAPVEVSEDCRGAKNTCPDYAPGWKRECPAGKRCVTFVNNCAAPVALAYQTGCDGDGTPGAPQCNCTTGPSIGAGGGSVTWTITDGDYASCLPAWSPPCLTAGLAVIANLNTASCTAGTRVEFTAGNHLNTYSKFDNYDIDVEKAWFAVPVSMAPNLRCAVDSADHNCRPLYCDSAICPDAYSTPTTGIGCKDNRTPAAGCRDTFDNKDGYTVTFCPTSGASCQDAAPC